MKRLSLLLAGIAAFAAVPAAAQNDGVAPSPGARGSGGTLAIVGGRVVIGDGSEPIENGTVLIRDGVVIAAGANIPVPLRTQVVDAHGKWVTPGVVAGFSRIGLIEVDGVDETNDVAANNSPFNAAIDVVPAINPEATAVAVSRAAGVTRAVVSPGTGHSIFGGQGAVIDLGADMHPITRGRLFQYVELGEEGAGDAGGSRASAHMVLRNALREARELSRRGGRPDDVLLTRADATALVEVLAGRQLLLVHAERASDILQVLQLRVEFPTLRIVLVGATEGWRVSREIASARVPVIANALNDLPASFEQLSATQSNVGRLRAAGVTVAIGMLNDDEARQVRLSTQYAGNLVALTHVPGATGLTWSQAFAAISSAPAEALGLGGEIGSLRPGRRGDVVIWDGDPLELATGVDAVWIDGVRQSLENRQTRLRDRYRQPQEGNLPHSYDPR